MSTPSLPPAAHTPYCELCGLPLEPRPPQKDTPQEDKHDGGHAPPSYLHSRCADLLQLEPPRFCGTCGRRLKVQVSPMGWWASCSRHGVNAS
ncbi:biotin synthase auxiliary protein BsaP [Paenarthrobacter sp. 22069]|uniref:biotin synthase auxiliary protein BsaP n=1 Tax=Paenarthrobacter sp. 22069 TaxID=3453864 RepID=UPI003F878873